ncbi:MAG: CoB--CoM heterodisulfide reductase subunit B [Candidatus Lokiarchaeota archaeon]|nr:CoB--CoM heterodisulfide reductase subunit B [Candidatus Lokiarchaeota archaeon]
MSHDDLKKMSYFLGCLTPNRYPGIEKATIDIMRKFGYELEDMKGASCCPAPGVFGSFDLNTWVTIAARNLAIAEESGNDIIVTCNGCYGSLQETNHILHGNPEKAKYVNDKLNKIGKEWKGISHVKHVVEILRDEVGYNKIRDAVVQPLTGLKVGVHYGCHFLKPSKVRGQGSSETPVVLEKILEAIGAEPVEYEDKLMCCGAGGGVRAAFKDVSLDFTRTKVENMLKVGIDVITTPCAFCVFEFDVGQTEVNQAYGTNLALPVIFITQLIGLALGISPQDMGLLDQTTPVTPVLKKLGLKV